MPKRQMRNPSKPVTMLIASKRRGKQKITDNPKRGPMTSHTVPIITRQRIVPVTAAKPAFPSCGLVRPKSSRITGNIDARANVDTKEMKKPNHDMWKDM